MRRITALALLAVVGGLGMASSVQGSHGTATITVSPSQDLAEVTTVTVAGTGFASSQAYTVSQCLSGSSECGVQATGTTDAAGEFTQQLTVRRTFGTVDCGISSCVVKASDAAGHEANPVPISFARFTLNVTTSGSGSGYVTSSPAGIDCGRNISGHTDCAETYPAGTSVTLTALPEPDTDFSGWSGPCTGTQSTCTVAMSQARAVTASFATTDGGGGVNPGSPPAPPGPPSPSPPATPPLCKGEPATIVGTPGPDELKGTPGRDVIAGLSGDDVISGFVGDDVVCAGSGIDSVQGGEGHDTLGGGSGEDDLRGKRGNDLIDGHGGPDRLGGGPGIDGCRGGRGVNTKRRCEGAAI